MIIAVSDSGGPYEYPREVRYEIRQGVKGDYARAAEFVNYSDVRLVSIQHEYGIFGGDDGAYILDLLTALHAPAIATLHTVLKREKVSGTFYSRRHRRAMPRQYSAARCEMSRSSRSSWSTRLSPL